MRRCPACWRYTQGVVCWRSACRDVWEEAVREAERRSASLPPTYEWSRRDDIEHHPCAQCGKPAWRRFCSNECRIAEARPRRALAARKRAGYQPWQPGKPGCPPKYPPTGATP